MRIAFVTDDQVIRREGTMLRRVAIGLIDEGVTVLSVEPTSARETGPERTVSGGPVEHIAYEDRGLALTRPLRTDRISAAIGRNGAPDVVHAIGVHAWRFGLDLARRLGAALCLDIHSARSVEQCGPFVRHASAVLAKAAQARGVPPRETSVVCVAADPTIARAASERAPHTAIRTAPWGVHRRGEHSPLRGGGDQPVSVCVLGEARQPAFVAPALEGLAAISRPMLVFVDEEADARGAVWRQAERLGIRERIDLAPSLEENRELALRCDALLLPGPTHRHRSLVLDAMAAGVAVAATRDPLVHVLNDPELAWLVPDDSPAVWPQALRSALVESPERATRLAAARGFVDDQRSPSRHIQSLLEVYESVSEPATISFQDP